MIFTKGANNFDHHCILLATKWLRQLSFKDCMLLILQSLSKTVISSSSKALISSTQQTWHHFEGDWCSLTPRSYVAPTNQIETTNFRQFLSLFVCNMMECHCLHDNSNSLYFQTYIGHILLLINPYKDLPIYSNLVSKDKCVCFFIFLMKSIFNSSAVWFRESVYLAFLICSLVHTLSAALHI